MFSYQKAAAPELLRLTLITGLLFGLAQAPQALAQTPPIRLPETVVPGELQEGTPPVPEVPRRPGGAGSEGPGPTFTSPFTAPSSVGQGYSVDNSTTAAKINLPNINFPGSISIVPADLIRDQIDTTTQQALRNVAGVNFQTGAGGREDDVFIRGFPVGFFDSYRKDGIVDRARVERDLANVDRIEVLKGPSSFLYGNSATPAGIINYILKKPLPYDYHEADVEIGYYDYYRVTSDNSGPISAGSPILYRMNVAAESSNSFRDYIFTDRVFVAPAVSTALGENTLVTFQTEYLHDQRTMDRGIPFLGHNALGVPISNYLGEPGDHEHFNDGRVSLLLDHRFSDNWALHFAYGSSWSWEDRDNFDTRNLTGPQLTVLTRSRVLQDPSLDAEHDGMCDVAGTVQTGMLRHHLLFGTEIAEGVFDSESNSSATGLPINIINPTYGDPAPFVGPMLHTRTELDQYGAYGQDLIDLTRYFKFLVGTRYTIFSQQSFNQAPAAGIPNIINHTDDVWVSHYGLLFAPIPDALTCYVAYGQSFEPVLGFTKGANDQAGSPLLPETGNSIEYGIKAQISKRLNVAVAWYDILRNNITQTDPTDSRFSLQIGQATSHGFEFEMGGKILERWSVTASYSHLDTVITEDTNLLNLGKRLASVPNYTGNLWTRYDLIQSDGMTFGFAVGMYTVGDVFADNPNQFRVPSWARWDGGCYFRMGRLSLSLYLENLGDIHYIASAQAQTLLQPGAPFNMRGMVRWSF